MQDRLVGWSGAKSMGTPIVFKLFVLPTRSVPPYPGSLRIDTKTHERRKTCIRLVDWNEI